MDMLRRIVAGSVIALCGLSQGIGQQYSQTNLVSNTPGAAPTVDSLLGNPWGLSRGPGNTWWMSNLNSATATMYSDSGVKQPLSIAVLPPGNPNDPQSFDGPAGILANDNPNDFLLTNNKPAEFLFSSIGGKIIGWNSSVGLSAGDTPPSTHAVVMVNNADGSAYSGMTKATVGGRTYLYLANFTMHRIDVYDNAFHPVDIQNVPGASVPSGGSSATNAPFVDDQLPTGYSPFNIQVVGNDLVVTYALLPPGSFVETDGPGNGYVDVYSSSGTLKRRLEHGNWMNAPWGIALAPANFGAFDGKLLVAQFAGAGSTQSSGLIAAFDWETGKFDGFLQGTTAQPVSISGVFAIKAVEVDPSETTPAQPCQARLYFTSGPNGGAGGLLGYLAPLPISTLCGATSY